MNGVQAAIFSGSAMVLLVLVLRLLFEKVSAARDLSDALVRSRVRLLLPITIPTHLERLNLLYTPATAQANSVISDVLTPFPSLATNSTAEPAADITGISPMLLLARLRDTFCGIFCDRICLHGTSVSRNTACSAAVH